MPLDFSSPRVLRKQSPTLALRMVRSTSPIDAVGDGGVVVVVVGVLDAGDADVVRRVDCDDPLSLAAEKINPIRMATAMNPKISHAKTRLPTSSPGVVTAWALAGLDGIETLAATSFPADDVVVGRLRTTGCGSGECVSGAGEVEDGFDAVGSRCGVSSMTWPSRYVQASGRGRRSGALVRVSVTSWRSSVGVVAGSRWGSLGVGRRSAGVGRAARVCRCRSRWWPVPHRRAFPIRVFPPGGVLIRR